MSSFWVVFFFAVGYARSCLCRKCVSGCCCFSSSVDRVVVVLSSFSHLYVEHVQSILNASLSPAPALVLALSERATENNLQTDPGDIAKIREAVKENKEACLCLLNYKKDGSTFHNQFFLTPLFDESGTLVSEKNCTFLRSFRVLAAWRTFCRHDVPLVPRDVHSHLDDLVGNCKRGMLAVSVHSYLFGVFCVPFRAPAGASRHPRGLIGCAVC